MAQFTESQIRAVAERMWFRKVSRKTLAKRNYLTEEQVCELQGTPAYRAYVEQIMFERRSAEDFEKWVDSWHRNHGNMYEAFRKRMGLEPEIVSEMVARIRQAHQNRR